VHMPKGKIVFNSGSIGEEFFIILKGEVGVYVDIPKSSEGRTLLKILYILF